MLRTLLIALFSLSLLAGCSTPAPGSAAGEVEVAADATTITVYRSPT